MSDALTEIARDQERAGAFQRYLVSLVDWLEAGAPADARDAVRAAAEDTDMVRGGYWGSSTNLSARVDERLDALAAGDAKQWGRLLSAADDDWNPELLRRLQAASPWKDGIVVFADYGFGFVRYRGALDRAIAKAVRAAGGTAFEGERHMLVLREDAFEGARIVTLQERRR